MYRRLLALCASLALTLTVMTGFAAATSTASTTTASATTAAQARLDRDCGDFANQRDAQNYFINHGGPDSDPDSLDADGDGVACESNPCPCSADQGGGSGTGPGGGAGGGQEPRDPPLVVQRGNVIRVIDGDTVEVRLRSGGKADVRLLGIDTPEVYGGVECGGPAASQSAKKMLPAGTNVVLRSDRSQDLKDRYGRLLRYVEKGRIDISLAQLRRGNARVYVYQNNPFNRVRAYRGAEATAKRRNVGLWGNCR